MPIRYFSLPVLGSAAAMGALALGLGACSDDPDRDETGAVTEAGDADVFQIEVGDCMSDQAAATGEVSEVPVVPCTEPHDSEVYFSYTIPDADTFPGDFQEHVDTQCVPSSRRSSVSPSSGLSLTWLEPTSESWDAGDRELLCIVADPAGGVTGTLPRAPPAEAGVAPQPRSDRMAGLATGPAMLATGYRSGVDVAVLEPGGASAARRATGPAARAAAARRASAGAARRRASTTSAAPRRPPRAPPSARRPPPPRPAARAPGHGSPRPGSRPAAVGSPAGRPARRTRWCPCPRTGSPAVLAAVASLAPTLRASASITTFSA